MRKPLLSLPKNLSNLVPVFEARGEEGVCNNVVGWRVEFIIRERCAGSYWRARGGVLLWECVGRESGFDGAWNVG